ncbi:MAG: AAA family ATPase [Candidatus Omnitrophica bacterium]|nr:AAA family ATPase [Candidatus Omnitrophota bacterium]MDD5237706.1 AAA family ATPase [Candidatus Omnitrophota bacterium]
MEQLYELNLRDLWGVLLKRKVVILISTVVIFSSTFIFTSLQTPLYQAAALLKVNRSAITPSEIMYPGREVIWAGRDMYEISDYTRQITSKTFTETSLRELGFIKEGMGRPEIEGLISDMYASLNAAEIENSDMIRLTLIYRDPEKAALLVNKCAEVFIRIIAEQKNQQVRNVRIFVEKTLNEVSTKLKDQEERLRVLTMQGATGAGVSIVQQISELEKKEADLSANYTQKHPSIVQLKEEIKVLREKLRNLPKEEFEYGVLKRDIGINEGLYTSLKQQLQEAQIKEAETVNNITLANPASVPSFPFYPNKARNYFVGIILGIFLGVTTALVTEHMDTSIGRVEDIENFIKANVMGVIPYCTEQIRGQEKKEKHRGLGAFFKKPIKTEAPRPGLVFELDQSTGNSLFLEAFRLLCVNLQVLFGREGRVKNKVIMITSCKPEEGKTLIVSTLGMTMAQMGHRVLIIDADTRRPRIHKVFGLKEKENGLTEVLTGKINPDAAIKTATDIMLGATHIDKIIDKPWINNLNIITAGSSMHSDISIFNSAKLDEVLNHFKNLYDIVLVDTSPILAVSETSILLSKTDGVLLVYRSGFASRLVLRRAKSQIESIKGKGSLSGVIINNVRPEASMGADYYYDKRYYGEEEKKKLGLNKEDDPKNV